MDDTDRRILDALREDASRTNAAVGERVGLTEAAVRRRIARMRSDGTIRRFTIVTSPIGPEGWVLLRCRPGRTLEIRRYLEGESSEVYETSGEFDLGALLERPSMEELNAALDALRARDGVVSTVTLVRLAHRSGRGSGAAAEHAPASDAAVRSPRPPPRPAR